MPKRLTILGSTGSIGRQTLEVVSWFSDRFEVVCLCASKSVDLLAEQIKKFKPQFVSVAGEEEKENLIKLLGKDSSCEILLGEDGLLEAARLPADLVVGALVGARGILPVLHAIRSGKNVALANKEPLVAAGEIVMREAEKNGVSVIPIDSEHSAIFQCIQGEMKESVWKIILTASGGPFLHATIEEMEHATVKEALSHPNWKMGDKITIDSATLMNKGLEIIEAHHLFGIPLEQIEVLIHPQSIIHSLVEFRDGSVKAQLGVPDMRIPIQYALMFPERHPNTVEGLSLSGRELTFMEPDLEKFPCLGYAKEAGEKGKTFPAVLNAANEEAVAMFLSGQIGFTEIQKVIKSAMDSHQAEKSPLLSDILSADAWARKKAAQAAVVMKEELV